MPHTTQSSAPLPTLRRLPGYYRFLQTLERAGETTVSCTSIAKALHLDPTGVRKDLAFTGIIGKPRVGYLLGELQQAIESFLGWQTASEAVLVGAGDFGRALLGYEPFLERGLEIVVAFDVNPALIGKTVRGKEVLPQESLGEIIREREIRIGIITTPAAAAQSIANTMVDAGIRAIWNFAPATLEVPDGVILEHVELAASLAILSSKLADADRRDH